VPFAINPQAESITALEITQPLLKGAGSDYALANLRLARIGNKLAYAQFRQKVEELVNQVQTGYWTLVLARGNLLIQQGLLQEATETLDKVEKRLGLDAAKNLEYKQTLAAQKQRQAMTVRAAKNVGDAEDQLARLLTDPRILLYRDIGIKPTVADPDTPELHLARAEQLLTAIRYSPLIEQIRYNIQSADINVQVARNELLPSLNLVASTGIEGLERRVGEAIESSYSFDFIDYAIGLVFEYPVANRTAKGKLSQRQNERRKSLTDLQNLADQLAVAIRESLRQIETTQFELAAQQEAINAWSDNLSALDAALEVGKQSYLLVLQLKLQAQESRAQARIAALAAKVAYWAGLARLEQLKGTSLQEHDISLALEAATEYGERVEGKRPPLRLPEAQPPVVPSSTSASSPTTISTIVGGQ
jgi:outer membrane protein TolC